MPSLPSDYKIEQVGAEIESTWRINLISKGVISPILNDYIMTKTCNTGQIDF